MDPFTIALAALNLGGQGYNLHQSNRLNRDQNQFGIQQHNAEIAAAQNAKAQYADDMARRKRQLMESLASRGVEDSTIARDDMNYLGRGEQRDVQGMDNRINLANKGLQLFKRGIKQKRHGNYLKFGLQAANALGGAGSSMLGGINADATASAAHAGATGLPASLFKW